MSILGRTAYLTRQCAHVKKIWRRSWGGKFSKAGLTERRRASAKIAAKLRTLCGATTRLRGDCETDSGSADDACWLSIGGLIKENPGELTEAIFCCLRLGFLA